MMIALMTICKPEHCSLNQDSCNIDVVSYKKKDGYFVSDSLGIDDRRRRGLKTRNARSDFTLRPCLLKR